MRPGQVDHVAEGVADLPEKLRVDAPRVVAYLSVYLRQINVIEELAQQVLDAFIEWRTTGHQRDWVLQAIGSWLDQPRPEGFSHADYAFILQARVLVRQSTATRDDVIRVAQFLARGNAVQVFFLVPKIVVVVFQDLLLNEQWQGLYTSLLTDAIDAVDSLTIEYTTSETSGYDIGEYDEELYGP